MNGLVTICHDARKGSHIGSHWPNHTAPLLYSTVRGHIEKNLQIPLTPSSPSPTLRAVIGPNKVGNR